MSIGKNLKRLREKRGIKQGDLAAAVGITPSMLCQIERGTKTLNLPLAKEFSDILHCRVEDFFEDSASARR